MAVRDRYLAQYKITGCLESHAAGPAIARAARRLLKREISGSEVARLAATGDPRAQRILQQAGFYLGLALANLVSTLNPSMIVVGGGVVDAGNVVLKAARETMMRWAQPIAVRQVRLVRSQLGDAASLLGVAQLALTLPGTPGTRCLRLPQFPRSRSISGVAGNQRSKGLPLDGIDHNPVPQRESQSCRPELHHQRVHVHLRHRAVSGRKLAAQRFT